jgi:erythromycin esterase-like protein
VLRDAIMADNLAYIVERERARGRVLAFAHNSHLQRGKAQ